MTTLAPPIWGPRRDQLVAYWTMDSEYISGSTYIDTTTANNNGTATANVGQGIGYIGNAATFNGTDTELTGSALGLSGSAPISIAAWINVDSAAGTHNNIFGFGNTATGEACSFRTDGDGGLTFYFWGNDLNVTCPNYYGTWAHVVAVYDPVGDARRIWLNGSQVGSDAPTAPNWTDTQFSIGGFNGSQNDEWFNGRIDELRIYNYPLFGSQIDTLYNQ